MTKILHLFSDTNLLIQCRPLEELDWGQWNEFDEVHVIVSRPVQKEIDKHKNSGGDRLAKRGRKAASLLREVIAGSADHKVIREASPRVMLLVRTEIKPSESVAGTLNYAEADDQLVGIVHSFASENPGCDARLLTHDTGPMASATAVNVPVAVIPDNWLLPPEQSEADKRIRSLEAEVSRLKEAEPAFDITCINKEGEECEKLHLEATRFETISVGELAGLVARLKERFALANDFGPRQRQERMAGNQGLFALALNAKEVFVPATDKEIEEYRAKHAQWLTACEDALCNLHATLQNAERPLVFGFRASNDGTRPAADVLVTLTAHGPFAIMPPPSRSDKDGEEKTGAAAEIELPSPPRPPKGKWRIEQPFDHLFGNAELLRNIAAYTSGGKRGDFFGDLLRPNMPRLRDPNEFYYADRPDSPVSEFSLKCKQWRHHVTPEGFAAVIVLTGDAPQTKGAVGCRIHAANASDPTTKVVPVQIDVKHVKVFARAQTLVERVAYSPVS
jgi:hypothetical protein